MPFGFRVSRHSIGHDGMMRRMANLSNRRSVTSFDIANESMNIVVRGPFAPGVFSPDWFRRNELVGESQLSDVQVFGISDEEAKLRLGWADFYASRDTLQFGTEQVEEFPRLRDLVVGTLEALPLHPVSVIGVNSATHTVLGRSEHLHRIGDVLAPKEPWNDVLSNPGLRSAVLWGSRDDGQRGRVAVTVEPSTIFEKAVYVSVNDHFDLAVETGPRQDRNTAFVFAGELIEPSIERRELLFDLLRDQWDAMVQRASAIHRSVLTIVE